MNSKSQIQEAGAQKLVSLADAAKYLRIGRTTIKRWIDNDLIESHRTPGGHRRVLLGDLIKFAQEAGIPVHPIEAVAEPIGKCVLLVDDEIDFLKNLAVLIKGLRPAVKVIATTNGFEAGILVANMKPELVFLDIRMPELDGVQACLLIKNTINETCVVGMTAGQDADKIQDLINAGAEEVLKKPFDVDKMECILGRYLGSSLNEVIGA